MEYVTQGSKYEAETVSVVLSFADLLQPTDSILGIPTITITVLSGIDTNPGNLIYGGVSIIGGNTVEQRFRLGVPGVIYTVTYTVQTTLGDTPEKRFDLAILPNTDNAIPIFLPLWESTQLYPIEPPYEAATGALSITAGTLLIVIINYTYSYEAYKGASNFIAGTLTSILVPYSYSHEDYKAAATLSAGTLVVIVIPYSYSHEDYKSSLALISGTLVTIVISYSYTHEDYKAQVSFTGGTLV